MRVEEETQRDEWWAFSPTAHTKGKQPALWAVGQKWRKEEENRKGAFSRQLPSVDGPHLSLLFLVAVTYYREDENTWGPTWPWCWPLLLLTVCCSLELWNNLGPVWYCIMTSLFPPSSNILHFLDCLSSFSKFIQHFDRRRMTKSHHLFFLNWWRMFLFCFLNFISLCCGRNKQGKRSWFRHTRALNLHMIISWPTLRHEFFFPPLYKAKPELK